MGFFGNKEKDGMDCQEDENGDLYCRKFKNIKGTKMATGSEGTIGVDPQTCKAFFKGRYSILEEDEADFEKMAKRKEASCKGGMQ